MNFRDVKPAFDKDNIAIAFAVDQNYVPYLKYAIKSIVANLKHGNLDVLVLHGGNLDGEVLVAHFKNCRNLSIRFVDASEYFNAVLAPYFVQRDYFTVASAYRIMIPELLPAYDKMLWLDADTLATGDIGELYGEDLAGSWLGAVKDAVLGDEPPVRDCGAVSRKAAFAWAKKYGFKPWQGYFNSGVMLMNLTALRGAGIAKRLIDVVLDPLSQWPDQDAMNAVCRGHVKYLDERWNFQVSVEPLRELQGPGIVHFTSAIKPWHSPDRQHAELWWRYLVYDCADLEVIKRILKTISDIYEQRLKERDDNRWKLKHSISYKLGRALTKPIRAITGNKDL